MSSVRVGTITFDWYPYEPRVLRLVQAAVDAGYQADVICLQHPGEKRYDMYNGVHIYRMPLNRAFGRSLPSTLLSWCWFLLLAGFTITWLHLKHRYDIVHVHNMPDFLVFSTLIVKLLGAKIILDVQDVSPELMAVKAKGRLRPLVVRLAIWQERISTTFVDHVVTVGWPFEGPLLKRGVPQEKLTSVLNSSDPGIFPPIRRCPSPADVSEGEQPFIVMYHGTLAERNGLDIAIRALALTREVVPSIRLDIMGQGEEVPHLKRLAARLDISDYVTFKDSCPTHEIVDFVVHGDVGIIPYRLDGFMEMVLPTKAYEFAWMQRAMIASDTPAMRSLFRSTSVALCDPGNPEAFAEAIIDLYCDREKRICMIAQAFEDYQPYRWEIMAERYQRLLATLSRKKVPIQRSGVSGQSETKVGRHS